MHLKKERKRGHSTTIISWWFKVTLRLEHTSCIMVQASTNTQSAAREWECCNSTARATVCFWWTHIHQQGEAGDPLHRQDEEGDHGEVPAIWVGLDPGENLLKHGTLGPAGEENEHALNGSAGGCWIRAMRDVIRSSARSLTGGSAGSSAGTLRWSSTWCRGQSSTVHACRRCRWCHRSLCSAGVSPPAQ